jgi:23S rRNA-/tRNA-specific pseudouridylate synthase
MFVGGPGVHISVAKLLPKLKELLKMDSELIMCNRLDEYTTGVMLFAL